jgi:FAD/FMN-containing dehydrogenase
MKTTVKEQDLEKVAYSTDASMIKGEAERVILPGKVEEIEEIVKSCGNIVPRGGGSGLVGGAVPQNSVVIDLSKMNKIIEIDKMRKTAYVEAGVILDDLQEKLEEYGLEFPVHPSSHSVCTIGGMIATNAVGSRGTRYGNTADWVQSIEVIDGKGDLRKINKLDIGDIAGREGITGIIVRCVLKLSELKKRTADLISETELDNLIEKVKELKREEDVSMIEFLDRKISGFLGFEEKYHLIIEYESEKGSLKNEKYRELIEKRDKAYPLLAHNGYVVIEDPKVILSRIKEIILWLEQRNIPFFGHIGSGILHPCFKKEQEKEIREMLKYIKKLSGSITGEHGIGLLKKDFIEDSDKILIERLKRRYDPDLKINKGKII